MPPPENLNGVTTGISTGYRALARPRADFDAYRHKRPLTLSQACLEAWADLKGGYPTPKALYNYCNDHKNLF